MKLLIATQNPHKVREIREMLEPLGYRVSSLSDLGSFVEPDEDGMTFADNARLKARAYARMTGVDCLADDSGLVVDALGGAPGVLSARYAGTGSSREERDAANNEKLLRELAEVVAEERGARFVCAMCLCRPDGSVVFETEGCFEGQIAFEPKGDNGFGYDPLLLLPELGLTSAQLSSEQKHARSHRGQALRRMVQYLSQP